MPRAQSYTRKQLAERASLTAEDFSQINQCRRDYNRLGFAYQVGFVRLMNRFPVAESVEIIDELLVYTGVQLQLDPESIADYVRRRQTVSEHQLRIREYLGLERLEGEYVQQLEAFLFEECFRIERTASLLARANEFLAGRGVLTPAESTIQRMISEQRAKARSHIHDRIAHQLPPEAESVFQELLAVDDSTRVSQLQSIKANPDKSSPEAILTLLTKMATIDASGILGVELGWLNANYQRTLFHHVRNCSVDRLRKLSKPRRDAAMTCFLWQSYHDAVDQAFNMFDKLLTRIETQAQNELDQRLKEKRRGIQESLSVLKVLVTAVLDEGIPDGSLRSVVYERIPKEQLQDQLASIAEWTDGKSSSRIHGVLKRFPYLRRFSPEFFSSLTFEAESVSDAPPCVQALQLLQELNEQKRRKLPEDTPTAFVPARFRPFVATDETPQRRPWECSLLYAIRDEIRSGNLSIRHSKRYGRFEDFFITQEQWQQLRSDFFGRSGLPSEPAAVGDFLTQRLNTAYDTFLASAPTNSYAKADENGWHLSVDQSEHPDDQTQQRVGQFKAWLGRAMRGIRLPELLIEVDNALGFTRHFTTPAQQERRTAEDICTIRPP